MHLTEQQVYYSKSTLVSLEGTDKVGEVENSPFKAVTMNRQLIEVLRVANTDYEARLTKLGEFYREAVTKFNDAKNKIVAQELSKEAEQEEIEKATNVVDQEFKEKAKEVGEIVYKVTNEKESRAELGLRSDKEIEITLTPEQQAFLRERIDKYGRRFFFDEQTWYTTVEKLSVC